MNECDQNGIGGDCGFDCSVFLRGECMIADELAEGANPNDMELYRELYDEQRCRINQGRG